MSSPKIASFPLSIGSLKKGIANEALLVIDVLFLAVADDHVVEALEGVACDLGTLPDDPEVVLEGPFPVQIPILVVVLERCNAGHHGVHRHTLSLPSTGALGHAQGLTGSASDPLLAHGQIRRTLAKPGADRDRVLTQGRRGLRMGGSPVAKGGIKLVALPVTLPYVTELASDLADDPTLTVGICGVTSPEQATIAIAAGAGFVVAPVCQGEIIKACKERGLEVLAGGATPTEVSQCVRLRPDAVTIHPAGAFGAGYVREVLSLVPKEVPLWVSGGIDVELAPTLLEAGAAGAVVDQGVFPADFEPGALDVITMRALALTEVATDILGGERRSLTTALSSLGG